MMGGPLRKDFGVERDEMCYSGFSDVSRNREGQKWRKREHRTLAMSFKNYWKLEITSISINCLSLIVLRDYRNAFADYVSRSERIPVSRLKKTVQMHFPNIFSYSQCFSKCSLQVAHISIEGSAAAFKNASTFRLISDRLKGLYKPEFFTWRPGAVSGLFEGQTQNFSHGRCFEEPRCHVNVIL